MSQNLFKLPEPPEDPVKIDTIQDIIDYWELDDQSLRHMEPVPLPWDLVATLKDLNILSVGDLIKAFAANGWELMAMSNRKKGVLIDKRMSDKIWATLQMDLPSYGINQDLLNTEAPKSDVPKSDGKVSPKSNEGAQSVSDEGSILDGILLEGKRVLKGIFGSKDQKK